MYWLESKKIGSLFISSFIISFTFYSHSNFSSFGEQVKCSLCNNLPLAKIVDLQHHLISRLHKDRVKDIFDILDRMYEY